jgi:hypothetical protein
MEQGSVSLRTHELPLRPLVIADVRVRAHRDLKIWACLEHHLPVASYLISAGERTAELVWNPEESSADGKTDSLPSMVTAIREQLGLELKRGRGQIEMVLVDYAEKASAN